MEKKVGKKNNILNLMTSLYLFMLLSIFQSSLSSDASIMLRMQDMNHKSIKQAMSQVPFIIQVELVDIEGYCNDRIVRDLNIIEHFKTAKPINKSHIVEINNGKKVTKTFYDIVVQSDKKGKFFVGPLYLHDKNGVSVKSNRLIVSVGDEIIASSTNQSEKYFLKVFFDKKQAYVGEKVKLHIHFYDRLLVDDLHLKIPNFQDVYIVNNQSNITKSTVTLDNEEYAVTQWEFDFYGKKADTIILQDISAVFFAEGFGMRSFDFFRAFHKVEQAVVAHPVKIDILPLPEHPQHKKVKAVGQFSQFDIAIDKNSAHVGQGIVLQMDLYGNANFHDIDTCSLVLPEHFNYYDSNLMKINKERNHKHSEFIIQASKEGQYHIPSQVLLYFDPESQVYKKIESNALDIMITPRVDNLTIDTVQYPDKRLQEQDDQAQAINFQIITDDTIYRDKVVIPQDVFARILFCLLLVLLFMFLYQQGLMYNVFEHKKVIKYITFLQAYFACRQAVKKHNYTMIYDAFRALFSRLIGVNLGHMNDADIMMYLKNIGCQDDEIVAWKIFYHKLLQASFSCQKVAIHEDLYHQAFMWINFVKDRA